tara:strand:+ start:5840 stop:6226 length:387 start_codon:yes stop_codon:yes gene_type:complete
MEQNMLSVQDVNVLGNLLNSTFGKGSSGPTNIMGSMQGDTMTLKFSSIVHFASETSMRSQMDTISHESISRMKNKISEIKKAFRDATGESLKLKEISNRDDLELIQATSNSPRKIACYRRFIDLQVNV